MKRKPNTEYILSLSYGKDSIACLEAIKLLGYPLDRIIHAEVWATDTIPADLPPMVEFKAYADKIIEEKYGIKVEHIYAVRGENDLHTQKNSTELVQEGNSQDVSTGSRVPSSPGVIQDSKLMPSQELEKMTYEKLFYHIPKRRKPTHNSNAQHSEQSILGFPIPRGTWCNSNLKLAALRISNLNRKRELVYSTQTEGFHNAPLRKARRKILCNISELPLTNQKE